MSRATSTNHTRKECKMKILLIALAALFMHCSPAQAEPEYEMPKWTEQYAALLDTQPELAEKVFSCFKAAGTAEGSNKFTAALLAGWTLKQARWARNNVWDPERWGMCHLAVVAGRWK